VIKLQAGEQQVVNAYVHSICAITLDDSKAYLIENRLSSILEDSRIGSFSEMVSRAKSDISGALQRRITDAITTNETSFFRDSAPFDMLKFKVIPDLIDRRRKANSVSPIRIWSAACSTGQELYSIAITLRELLSEKDRAGARLVGTDISDKAVAQASRGFFSSIEVSRGLSDAMRSKYFAPAAGGWKIRDDVRAMVSFRKANLFDDLTALGKFDIVFCRNVAIYFSDSDRIRLFRNIQRSMEADGYLIVGSMESLSGSCPQFEAQRHVRSVYYQLRPNFR
jgi:chemotaxis protein methyltransferase CheR